MMNYASQFRKPLVPWMSPDFRPVSVRNCKSLGLRPTLISCTRTSLFVILFLPANVFAQPAKIPDDSAGQAQFAEFEKRLATIVGDPRVDRVFSSFMVEWKGKTENKLFMKIGNPTKIELVNGIRYLHYDFPKCDYIFYSRGAVLESTSKHAKTF